MSRIVLGPILGFASQTETDIRYHCTVVLSGPGAGVPRIEIVGQNLSVAAVRTGVLPSGAEVWTAEFGLPLQTLERRVSYRWLRGQEVQERTLGTETPEVSSTWKFLVPGTIQVPKVLFASCNGFSSAKYIRDTANPFALWERMGKEDRDAHLLIMGGDQVYADGVLAADLSTKGGKATNLWLESTHKKAARMPWSPHLEESTRRGFEDTYMRSWDQSAMARVMATVPSVMMWDDHDIMDGWGSFPEELQNCPFLKSYYAVARWFFEILQVRGAARCRVLDRKSPNLTQFLRIGATSFLLLDGRSERTQNQVLSPESWTGIHAFLSRQEGLDTLFVVAAVPVVYLDFRTGLPLQEVTGSLDDLLDHWRHPRHVQEMTSLAYRLFDQVEAGRFRQIVLLSGDVHVGAWGKLVQDGRTIHQVISTGIVHPPPSRFEWMGVRAASKLPDGVLAGDKIQVRMCDPTPDTTQFIVARNYARLVWGTDDTWWATWKTEGALPSPSACLEA